MTYGKDPGAGCRWAWSAAVKPTRCAATGIDRPADICFARGTFNLRTSMMGAMAEFPERLETLRFRPRTKRAGGDLNGRAARLNARLAAERLAGAGGQPVDRSDSAAHPPLPTGCCNTTCASRAGLSWVGTGRHLSLNYGDAEFEVADRFRCRSPADGGGRLVVA